jgi:hypothetical protein
MNRQKYNSMHKRDETKMFFIGFEVLTVVSMKMAVFWVVAAYTLVVVLRSYRGACCLHHHAVTLMVKAANTSEMSVNFYQTIWRYNPEHSHLQNVLPFSTGSLLYPKKFRITK